MAAKDNNVIQKGVIAALGGDPEKRASSALRRSVGDYFIDPTTSLKKNGIPVMRPDDLYDAHIDRNIPCISDDSDEQINGRIYLNYLRKGAVELTKPIFTRIVVGMIALIVLITVIALAVLYTQMASDASGDLNRKIVIGLFAFVCVVVIPFATVYLKVRQNG